MPKASPAAGRVNLMVTSHSCPHQVSMSQAPMLSPPATCSQNSPTLVRICRYKRHCLDMMLAPPPPMLCCPGNTEHAPATAVVVSSSSNIAPGTVVAAGIPVDPMEATQGQLVFLPDLPNAVQMWHGQRFIMMAWLVSSLVSLVLFAPLFMASGLFLAAEIAAVLGIIASVVQLCERGLAASNSEWLLLAPGGRRQGDDVVASAGAATSQCIGITQHRWQELHAAVLAVAAMGAFDCAGTPQAYASMQLCVSLVIVGSRSSGKSGQLSHVVLVC